MTGRSTSPPGAPDETAGRLERCIRDLAALNALPSMCVGRTPEETLDIVLDALPTALSCELVYLAIPGGRLRSRASLDGAPVASNEMDALAAALDLPPAASGAHVLAGGDELWCFEADVPLGTSRGRLVAGRRRPLDPHTDRVLVRAAANLVGTTVEAANVLEAARHKDDFLAMLGHELRNPLAPILTAVELLARHPSVEREQRVIDRNTRHLARLVDDLLDISRVTRGHVELRHERTSLDAVLERALEIAAPLLTRAKHRVQVDRDPAVVLEGDPVRLAQVFGNLLSNAAKFTPVGGQVEVRITRLDGRVRVAVRDDGRGLDRAQLGRVFEPFVQIDRANDALGGGLGLGLAIVSNLVERHGGVITADSAGLGRGATFTVELPTSSRVLTPVVAPPPARGVRRGVRVMVVDDNADIAELLSLALTLEGFETQVALDGESAIAGWRTFAPHAGVLDVGMPSLDGYQLARLLRAEHGDGPTLIAATGYGQPRDRVLAADAGFDCHFVKPVRIEDLVSALDQRVRVGPTASVA